LSGQLAGKRREGQAIAQAYNASPAAFEPGLRNRPRGSRIEGLKGDDPMDRDPRENMIDSEDDSTPTDGRSDFGESGAERARTAEDRNDEQKPEQPQIAPPPD
jgi:hypothetical protein